MLTHPSRLMARLARLATVALLAGLTSLSISTTPIRAQCSCPASWQTLAPMNQARAGHIVVAVGGFLYAIGGATRTQFFLASVERYDPATNTWATEWRPGIPWARYPGGRNVGVRSMCAAVLNSKIYVLGGEAGGGNHTNEVWVFDPALNTWTRDGSLNTGRSLFECVAWGGKIYVFGGFNGGAELASCEEYTPGTPRGMGTSRSFVSLSQGRRSHGAGIIGTWAIVMGGRIAGAQTATATKIDLASPNPTWMPCGNLSVARTSGASVSHPCGSVFYLGGSPTTAVIDLLGSTSFCVWSPCATPLPRATSSARAAVLGGKIYVCGGEDPAGSMANLWVSDPCQLPVAYGQATPHCAGAPRIEGNGCPFVGNFGFAINVSNALPSISGVVSGYIMVSLARATGQFACANGNQFTLNVLPNPFSPVWVVVPISINGSGNGSLPVPIPNSPVLRGLPVYFQFYENHPSLGCACVFAPPDVGGSASQGLSVEIQ